MIRFYGTTSPSGFTYGTFLVVSGGAAVGGGLQTLAGWGTFSSASDARHKAVLVHRRVAMCHCSEVLGSAAGQARRRSRPSCLMAAEGLDYSRVGRRRCGDLPGMSTVAARSSATPARRRAAAPG